MSALEINSVGNRPVSMAYNYMTTGITVAKSKGSLSLVIDMDNLRTELRLLYPELKNEEYGLVINEAVAKVRECGFRVFLSYDGGTNTKGQAKRIVVMIDD